MKEAMRDEHGPPGYNRTVIFQGPLIPTGIKLEELKGARV